MSAPSGSKATFVSRLQTVLKGWRDGHLMVGCGGCHLLAGVVPPLRLGYDGDLVGGCYGDLVVECDGHLVVGIDGYCWLGVMVTWWLGVIVTWWMFDGTVTCWLGVDGHLMVGV